MKYIVFKWLILALDSLFVENMLIMNIWKTRLQHYLGCLIKYFG